MGTAYCALFFAAVICIVHVETVPITFSAEDMGLLFNGYINGIRQATAANGYPGNPTDKDNQPTGSNINQLIDSEPMAFLAGRSIKSNLDSDCAKPPHTTSVEGSLLRTVIESTADDVKTRNSHAFQLAFLDWVNSYNSTNKDPWRQILWGAAEEVGCAMEACEPITNTTTQKYVFACKYDVTAASTGDPYVAGKACQQCKMNGARKCDITFTLCVPGTTTTSTTITSSTPPTTTSSTTTSATTTTPTTTTTTTTTTAPSTTTTTTTITTTATATTTTTTRTTTSTTTKTSTTTTTTIPITSTTTTSIITTTATWSSTTTTITSTTNTTSTISTTTTTSTTTLAPTCFTCGLARYHFNCATQCSRVPDEIRFQCCSPKFVASATIHGSQTCHSCGNSQYHSLCGSRLCTLVGNGDTYECCINAVKGVTTTVPTPVAIDENIENAGSIIAPESKITANTDTTGSFSSLNCSSYICLNEYDYRCTRNYGLEYRCTDNNGTGVFACCVKSGLPASPSPTASLLCPAGTRPSGADAQKCTLPPHFYGNTVAEFRACTLYGGRCQQGPSGAFYCCL